MSDNAPLTGGQEDLRSDEPAQVSGGKVAPLTGEATGSNATAISNRIGQLSIDVDGLSRQAEEIASYASYGGTELQVDALLGMAGELRALAAEIEALR